MSRLVLRADAYQGVTKGRWALLELGRKRPDVIDSGVVAWNEEQYGPDEGRVKMRLSFKAQVQAAAGCLVRPCQACRHAHVWSTASPTTQAAACRL